MYPIIYKYGNERKRKVGFGVKNKEIIKEIELVDLTGKVIEIFEVNNDKFYIDLLNRYSIGVYILVINTELNKFRKKIGYGLNWFFSCLFELSF